MLHRGVDEQDLRRKALAAVRAEALPCAPPQRTWGGSGCGRLCLLCGHSIESAEVEMELEFDAVDGETAPRVFHLHQPCFAAWEIARESAARNPA